MKDKDAIFLSYPVYTGQDKIPFSYTVIRYFIPFFVAKRSTPSLY